jgi:hypothetical protein
LSHASLNNVDLLPQGAITMYRVAIIDIEIERPTR